MFPCWVGELKTAVGALCSIGRWWAAGAAAPHALLLHGFKFLLLIVGQNGLDAVVGAFHDGAHLGSTVFLRDATDPA